MASEDLPANGHGGPADPNGKPKLRRALRAARAAYVARLDVDERTRLEAGLAHMLAQHLPSGIVAGYCAAGSEIGLGGVKRVTLLPRVIPGQPLGFHAGPALPALDVVGLGRIAEPPADAPRGEPDILLVPLLAVDDRGTRLGQGGGHYDRTLAALRARRRVLAVGVGWDMQRVELAAARPVGRGARCARHAVAVADIRRRERYVPDMKPTLRRPAGILGMIAYLIVYAGLVVRLLAPIGMLPWYVAVPLYAVLGCLWLLPMKPLLQWMETGTWRAPR